MTDLPSLLQHLEEQWRRLGVDVEGVLKPGLSARDVAEQLTALVGTAHDDVLDWFNWHDGSWPETRWVAAPTGSRILPLEHCLRLRGEMLTINSKPGVEEELPRWHSHWLPLTDDPAAYTVDMTTGQFLLVDWWDAEFVSTPADDLAGAVSVWAQALRDGHYRWSNDQWAHDYATLPLWLRTSGLVR
jgi:hypothetical protein